MKKSLNRILIISLLTGLLALVFTGCQTSEGFGRDVENLGESMQ